jgi:hypothetical protein
MAGYFIERKGVTLEGKEEGTGHQQTDRKRGGTEKDI